MVTQEQEHIPLVPQRAKRPARQWGNDVRAVAFSVELLYSSRARGKVRYKQAAFGAAWAIIQPRLHNAHFHIFSSGRMANIPSGGIRIPFLLHDPWLPGRILQAPWAKRERTRRETPLLYGGKRIEASNGRRAG